MQFAGADLNTQAVWGNWTSLARICNPCQISQKSTDYKSAPARCRKIFKCVWPV